MYAYKVTQTEQDELQAALREAISLNPELKQQEQRAAFCLFGAEWFRRHHEHGRNGLPHEVIRANVQMGKAQWETDNKDGARRYFEAALRAFEGRRGQGSSANFHR